MITIEEAVRYSIDEFIKEDIFTEKKKKHRKKNKHSKKKGSIKKKGGQRGDFDYESDKKYNSNVSAGDQEELANELDNPAINLAGVAHEMYPDHTDEGAQSQLRKKIKGLRSDSGSKYHLKQREVRRLRRILHKLHL